MVVSAGAETNRKPFLAGVGGQLRAEVGGVVAVTSMVAESSRKRPRKASSQSRTDLTSLVPFHFSRRELMTALTCPIGWKVFREFGIVKPSKTTMFFASSVAVSASRSTSTLPGGMAALHMTPLGLTPGSHE